MHTIRNIIKRTAYLVYYLRKMDWPKFMKLFRYAKKIKSWSSLYLIKDAIECVYRYNIGLIDYFLFRFFELESSGREEWVGTGYKYEYDLIMNPKKTRHILENKLDFYNAYAPFVIHGKCSIEDIRCNNKRAERVLNNPTGKIVIKDSLGQCGWDVEVLNMHDFRNRSLLSYMKSKGFSLAEEYIVQHPEMQRLSDSGVNTLRIITQLNTRNEVVILGARLRVSVNNHVDNMASGNIAAPVDIKTGIVDGAGVYSDISRINAEFHPVTGTALIGFKIPLWDQCITLVKNAALHRPENRSVGWDVVLTDKGPELLEGNHNWCKILWQIPVNKGLKHILQGYLDEYQKIIQ